MVEKAPPSVHVAWAATMADLLAVGKDNYNKQQGFKFRGIDQLYNALAGPMRKNGVMLVPEVESRDVDMVEVNGKFYMHCKITMRYTIYGPAGDGFTGSMAGEALDQWDKATSKAESMALKYFLFAAAMIPLDESSVDDADRHSAPDEGTFERRPPSQPRQRRSEPVPGADLDPLDKVVADIASATTVDRLMDIMGGLTAVQRKFMIPGEDKTVSQFATERKAALEGPKAPPSET
jgi:hypothetical protein